MTVVEQMKFLLVSIAQELLDIVYGLVIMTASMWAFVGLIWLGWLLL